jgi:hypothetical protein
MSPTKKFRMNVGSVTNISTEKRNSLHQHSRETFFQHVEYLNINTVHILEVDIVEIVTSIISIKIQPNPLITTLVYATPRL